MHAALVRSILCAAFPLVGTAAHAATYVVAPDGTGDVPTIQAAVDTASDGDVILLTAGTFRGPGNWDVHIDNKSLTVGSESHSTIDYADGADGHRGFILAMEGTDAIAIRDITFIRASGWVPGILHNGAAISMGNNRQGNITIERCTFIECYAAYGGAVFTNSDQVVVRHCVFQGCIADGAMGSAYLKGSRVTITDSWILDSVQGGMLVAGFPQGSVVERCVIQRSTDRYGLYIDGDVLLKDCLITDHEQPGVFVAGARVTMEGCTLARNAVSDGQIVLAYSGRELSMERSIVAFSRGGAAVVCSLSDAVEISCSNLFGNAGGNWIDCLTMHEDVDGNFSADPLFCDDLGQEFTLNPTSPCVPGHHPFGFDCGLIGARGLCAATPIVSSSWGGLKHRFGP